MPERSKQKITYALIILTTLPFVFAVKHPNVWSFSSEYIGSMARYISSVSGYVGIALLLWMYILGTRTVTGLFYTDLPWTMWLHRKLGKYGTLAVFSHPFSSAYVYGESVFTYWLKPSLDGEFATHVTYGRVAFIALLIVWFSSAYLRKRMSYRPWKYLHYLAYVSLPLALLHTRDIGSSINLPWVQFYFFGFVTIYLLITVLRARYFFGYGKMSYQVIENSAINQTTYKLVLSPKSKMLQPLPGQYIYVQLRLLGEEHPFSVVNTDKDGNITLMYKKYGKFTAKLSQHTEGNFVYVDGAYGKFTHDLSENPEQPSVFLAAGIGVTPFVHHMKDRTHTKRLLFYSLKSGDETVFDKKSEAQMKDRLIYAVGGSSSEGRLSIDLLKKYIHRPKDYTFYVCGPKGYIHDVEAMLTSLGVDIKNIHSEKFSF